VSVLGWTNLCIIYSFANINIIKRFFFLVIISGWRSREMIEERCLLAFYSKTRARTRKHHTPGSILYYIPTSRHTYVMYISYNIGGIFIHACMMCPCPCVFFKARRIKSRHICGLPSRLGVRARASASTSVSSSRGLDHTPLRRLAWVSALSFLLRYKI